MHTLRNTGFHDYVILWFIHNVMDVVNVVIFFVCFSLEGDGGVVIVSDTTNEFLPGGNKDLLN